MAPAEGNSPFLQRRNYRLKSAVLRVGKLFTAFTGIRNGKVHKNTVDIKPRQSANLRRLFYRFAVTLRRLKEKADAAHAGVDFQMRADRYACLFRFPRKRRRITGGKQGLCDLVFRKLCRTFRWCIT